MVRLVWRATAKRLPAPDAYCSNESMKHLKTLDRKHILPTPRVWRTYQISRDANGVSGVDRRIRRKEQEAFTKAPSN
ncbi:hypothetical protein TNCV_5000361 [Trichonephila clavipes]|nr:hypothetical protein TNCV_5000361 [Trichonephila clavipes]